MSLQETSITHNDSLYRYYYLCKYLPLSAGVDPLSRSLLKFKRGIQPDLDAWIESTLEVFHNIPLSPDTVIIRALRHDETQVHESPPASLDLLGQALAANFQCQYRPSLLRKSRTTLSNKGLTRNQRETQLNNVYSIAYENLPQAAPPIPFGTTIRTIIYTLHQAFPHSPLQIFTLARVEHDPDLNHSANLG
jgi:predicted amidophosphoribosyltransferase